MSTRWGIFGGTFDPIHLGHLRAAEEIYEALALKKIIFIPAGFPPHKHRPDLSPFPFRYQMVKLAIEGIPYFEVSEIEAQLKGPSYSLFTLQELTRRFPKVEFFFILGLDAFLEFETWYQYQDLPRLTHLVVIPRGPGGMKEFDLKTKDLFPEAKREKFWQIPGGKTLRFVSITRFDISATTIRKLVRKGNSIRFLVPDKVRSFILENNLYVSLEETRSP